MYIIFIRPSVCMGMTLTRVRGCGWGWGKWLRRRSGLGSDGSPVRSPQRGARPTWLDPTWAQCRTCTSRVDRPARSANPAPSRARPSCAVGRGIFGPAGTSSANAETTRGPEFVVKGSFNRWARSMIGVGATVFIGSWVLGLGAIWRKYPPPGPIVVGVQSPPDWALPFDCGGESNWGWAGGGH